MSAVRANALILALALAASACVAPPRPVGEATPDVPPPGWPAADLLLVGEQHDAAEHQRRAAQVVLRLAGEDRLIAVVMEMAEQGRSTTALRRDADEAQMRDALAWDERGWPWAAYGPIVVAAVRAEVPVIGANLPRGALRDATADTRLDAEVSDSLRQRLLADVRDGHCGLLPEAQLPGMTRVQIGRDRAMAGTLAALAQPGGVVMLVAGANHVDKNRGVPQHLRRLAPALRLHALGLVAGAPAGQAAGGFDEIWVTAALQRPADACAGLAERLAPAAR